MKFAEQPPSKQWAPLKFRGETIAEVWFKPEGEPGGLALRVPVTTFQIPGLGDRLTAESLLKAVGVAADDVEACRYEGAADLDLKRPLAAPPGVDHLEIHVRLKAAEEVGEPAVSPERWQDLGGRWRAIEGLEATIDTLRLRMDGLRAEMEAASGKALTMEEKTHALNADVAQWTKAKNRVHHALPRVKEFIHRATWALATPERKALGELFKDHARPHLAADQLDKVREQMENLLKDRQILSAQGVTVQQECESIAAEVQAALRLLQNNAAANARRKLGAARAKGKRF